MEKYQKGLMDGYLTDDCGMRVEPVKFGMFTILKPI